MTGFKFAWAGVAAATIWFFAPSAVAWSHEPAISSPGKETARREVSLPIRGFSLIDQDGRPFRFDDLRGKVIVVAFAYTSCPDVCPLITAAMRSVQDRLSSAERASVHLVTVTTDPEIDAPKVLRAYARRYGVDLSNWSFLTGDIKALEPVWKNFGVMVRRKARGLIDHTALTGVIDQGGTVRFAYYGASPDTNMLLRDLRSLLVDRP